MVETQAEIAAADLELDGVSQLIAERAQELTGATGATVSILDGEELLTAASVGDTASGGSGQRPAPPPRAERRLAQRGEGRQA